MLVNSPYAPFVLLAWKIIQSFHLEKPPFSASALILSWIYLENSSF